MFDFLRRRRNELAVIDAEFTALTEAFTRRVSESDQDFQTIGLMADYALVHDAYEKAKAAFAEDRESEAALRALAECRHAFARFNTRLESPVHHGGHSPADASAAQNGFDIPADTADDLARGRALASDIMNALEQELRQEEAATGRPLEAARSLLKEWRAGDPGDLYGSTDEIEMFTAELALARAARFGDAYRPCPFDPYHAGASVRALWRPQGAAPRSVLCCPDDAVLIRNGGQPAARLVPGLSGKVPLWDADDVYTRWLLGHFAAVGTAEIREVYRDTVLGRTLHLLRGR